MEDHSLPPATPRTAIVDDPCGEIFETALLAGQQIVIGHIVVSNNETTLQVEIVVTEPGWVMSETHVGIEDTFEDLPMTGSGNPKVGKFEFSTEYDEPVMIWAYEIDLAEYGYAPLTQLYGAVHAAVELRDEYGNTVQEETAWAEGPEFPGNSWAMYFGYVVQECTFGPGFEVTYPTAGTQIWPGDTIEVTWSEEFWTPVMIELLYDSAVIDNITYDPEWGLPFIIPEEGMSLSSFTWSVGCYVEAENPDLYQLRVTAIAGEGEEENIWTTSDYFTIVPDCGSE
ncbi:MAG: hypothetical protein GF330_04085 [Candidatus Eisenbacteria bacterium]|nr:hypothetical protein [Candidatus Eisenbacteria bacterium]